MPVAEPKHEFSNKDFNHIAEELQTGGNGSFAAAIGKALQLADMGNAVKLAETFNDMFYYSLSRWQRNN